MFDLAPGGVYRATSIAQGAGALLPHRFTLTCARLPEPSAVCSLWHCPARHRDSRFVSTLPCGAPTFLTARCRAARPPSRLTIRVKSDTRSRCDKATTGYETAAVASPRGRGVRSNEPVLEVGEFYQLLTAHLEAGFGRRRPHWVRGEIAKVYEKGHVYVDLVDAGSTASATPNGPSSTPTAGRRRGHRSKRRLAAEGVTLKPGMVVSFYGYVDLYAPQGRIGFSITEIDVEGLLGDVARRRQELIARLSAEGLLETQQARRALAGAPAGGSGREPRAPRATSDFTGQLLNSGFSFAITLVKTLVQGEGAPPQIVAAIETLDEHGVDVICVVRGRWIQGRPRVLRRRARRARHRRRRDAGLYRHRPHRGRVGRRPRRAHPRDHAHQARRELVAIVAHWYAQSSPGAGSPAARRSRSTCSTKRTATSASVDAR